jgi:hypothetical protein
MVNGKKKHNCTELTIHYRPVDPRTSEAYDLPIINIMTAGQRDCSGVQETADLLQESQNVALRP